jgi:hypothetical protein
MSSPGFHLHRRLIHQHVWLHSLYQWHALGREEQSKYYELARKERQVHMQLHPGWTARDNYAQGKKRKRRREKPSEVGGKPINKKKKSNPPTPTSTKSTSGLIFVWLLMYNYFYATHNHDHTSPAHKSFITLFFYCFFFFFFFLYVRVIIYHILKFFQLGFLFKLLLFEHVLLI